MKKICLIAFIAVFGMSFSQAQQVRFGASGGLFLGTADVTVSGLDVGNFIEDLGVLDGGGFYLGFLADLELTKKLHVQPELLYANIGGESAIILPVMVKVYVADKFNLQAGPQFDYIFDVPENVEDLIKAIGLSVGLGVGYDLGDAFALQAKYTFGLNNRVDAPSFTFAGLEFTDPTVKTNILQIGVVYKFN